MKENKALNVLLCIAKILLILILSVSFVYYAYGLIDSFIESKSMDSMQNTISIDPFPLFYAVGLIFSIISNGACVLLALLGLIVSHLYKGCAHRRKNIITFRILLLTPFVLELFYLLVGIFSGILFS